MTKHILRGLIAVGAVAGSVAHAAGPDFSALTGAVDMATVITAIIAIAVILVGVAVAKKGARMIIAMIGR